MFNASAARLGRMLRQVFCQRDARKRRVSLSLLKRGTGIALRSLARVLFDRSGQTPAIYSRRPTWYDK
jgi:hypothetical protein